MTVEEHYRKLLQLPRPWEVTTVEESLMEQRVTVWLRWPDRMRACCPECGQEALFYDRLAERSWRHLSVIGDSRPPRRAGFLPPLLLVAARFAPGTKRGKPSQRRFALSLPS